MWYFLILFPLLFGHPVKVAIETFDEVQCLKVRKVMVQQLDNHRSNAGVGPCQLVPESAPSVPSSLPTPLPYP